MTDIETTETESTMTEDPATEPEQTEPETEQLESSDDRQIVKLRKESARYRTQLRETQSQLEQAMAQLTAAMAAGDAAAAFRAVHTLKGIALNLSLSDLADACAALTERLRGRDALPDGIQPQYDAVLAQHTRILDALAQLTP